MFRLGVALIVAVLAAAPAYAASGTLSIDGAFYSNPSGCIDLQPSAAHRHIANLTDETVRVYRNQGCALPYTDIIGPGVTDTVLVASVSVV